MVLEELKLTLTTEGYEYRITNIQNVEVSSRKDAMSIAPPGLAASENILLGINGKQADITIRFMIHNDGTDKADGSYSSVVTSLDEQTNYLEKTMQDPSFAAQWQLDHPTGSAFNSDEVFFEGFDSPKILRDSPKWFEATIRLRRGGSI